MIIYTSTLSHTMEAMLNMTINHALCLRLVPELSRMVITYIISACATQSIVIIMTITEQCNRIFHIKRIILVNYLVHVDKTAK